MSETKTSAYLRWKILQKLKPHLDEPATKEEEMLAKIISEIVLDDS